MFGLFLRCIFFYVMGLILWLGQNNKIAIDVFVYIYIYIYIYTCILWRDDSGQWVDLTARLRFLSPLCVCVLCVGVCVSCVDLVSCEMLILCIVHWFFF